MATINIYVSDDLKLRMAAHPEVNWSTTAQRAFENALRDHEARARWYPTQAIDVRTPDNKETSHG